MTNLFFTADLHLCHNKDFLYEPRGFSSVEEMNEAIVERWNKVVKPDDMVTILGDIALNDTEKGIEYLKRLNGQINIVWGNHDTFNKKLKILSQCPMIIDLGYAHQFKHGKFSFYLSHYISITSNFDDKKFSQHLINLHGHTHQQTNWAYPENPFIYHVGCDSHNCTPVHIDEILTDIRQHWNEVEQLPTTIKPRDLYPFSYEGELYEN